MTNVFGNPSPGGYSDDKDRLDRLKWFWHQLFAGDHPGETTWEELEVLRADVNKALAKCPPDISRADGLTAYAMLLTTGLTNL
jgi:hypothetical protein